MHQPAIEISKVAKAPVAAHISFHRRWRRQRPSKGILQTSESFSEADLLEEIAMKLLLIMLATVAALIGCNTMEGAGKDIEKAGDKIQEKAKK